MSRSAPRNAGPHDPGFIGVSHVAARLYGVDLRQLLTAQSLEEQRRFFETMLGELPDPHDKAAMIDLFNRHNAEVLAAIPKDRMLVYEVKQGQIVSEQFFY